jgi:NADPH:quinone reductase-like Zn-dependent oxidoreductase
MADTSSPPDSVSEGRQIRSLVRATGVVELSVVDAPPPAPGPDEVVVRVEAAPINPSDLGLLLAGADVAEAHPSGDGVAIPLSPAATAALTARHDQSLPVGNEGAGVVVATGSSDAAQALHGRVVGIVGGATYSQYRTVRVDQCLPFPEGVTPAQGASWFVNPMTALGMVETMRLEGHTALVHTAAASNLGQMLNRLCLADGTGLVSIVRSSAQVDLLRSQGAVHVLDSTTPTFDDDLRAVLVATGATLAFDAIGGGTLGSRILTAMEAAANATATEYSRYGSSTYKQLYIYGALDRRPTELARTFGFRWGAGGWLLTPFLQRIGADAVQRLRARVAAEITTTFASHYTATISLDEALDIEVLRSYARMRTGEKYLIDPSR